MIRAGGNHDAPMLLSAPVGGWISDFFSSCSGDEITGSQSKRNKKKKKNFWRANFSFLFFSLSTLTHTLQERLVLRRELNLKAAIYELAEHGLPFPVVSGVAVANWCSSL